MNYEWVYQLKREFPQLTVVLNGGITELGEAQTHLKQVDGVMLGRAAYQNPWLLSEVDSLLFGEAAPVQMRSEAIENLIPYIEQQLATGTRLNHITRHVLGLFNQQAGGRQFRRVLSEGAHKPGANSQLLREALSRCQPRPASP